MRILVAFLITTLIYIFLIWIYLDMIDETKIVNHKSSNKIIKIDLINLDFSKKSKNIKKEQKKLIKEQKILKKSNSFKKKLIKKNIKKKKKNKRRTQSRLIKESEMLYIPNPIIKNNIDVKDSVYATFSQPQMDKIYPNSKIEKLYGKEFFSYTSDQKKFIEKNLDEIHRVTQNMLWRRGYPGGETSAKTRQEGVNIVSFFLHPNGDISELKLKKKVGYRLLDENTLETIKSAYKDYPYPKKKTKIIFYVEYSIF